MAPQRPSKQYERGKMGHKLKQPKIINGRTDFYYYMFRNILLVSIPLVIISALVLSLSHSSAKVSSVDSFTVSVLSSCTLSSKVNNEHSISTINGTYIEDVGKTTISTFCNDKDGYVVYAVGDSDNTVGNNKLISSINSNYDIVSGTETSGNTSQWAMKLSALSSNIGNTNNPGYITNNNNETVATNQGTDTPTIGPSYNNTYGIVPTTWTRVVYKPSGTVNSVSGSSFSTTYSIYTSPTQPAGTYAGQVKYLLAHPSNASVIGGRFMQDVAEWGDALGEGESAQAIDERDGKSYWVTKLKDGHIWMTQNLDLCIGCKGVAALTSENTDISPDSNAYTSNGIYSDYSVLNGVYTWVPTSTATTSGKIVDYGNNNVSGWGNNSTKPYSAEGGDTYLYTSNSTADDIRYDSLSECTSADHPILDCQHYHVGNYYNWSAAIASNNSANISTNYAQAANSICPKGWRLPTASNSNKSIYEFGNLLYSYGITAKEIGDSSYTSEGFYKIRTSPLWFVRSGYIDGQLHNGSIAGYYWSSVSMNGNSAYPLYFDSSNVHPASSGHGLVYDGRSYGRSIRCLARTED